MNCNIADLILRRRLQMLVHSAIYYNFNKNIISDRQWDIWARELKKLQEDYPDISETVAWYDAFKDWDASTGAFLPLDDEWVVNKARYILSLGVTTVAVDKPQAVKVQPKKKKGGRLF